MIYLKQFYFAKEEDEYDFVSDQKMTCFNTYYPFSILPRNQFRCIDCDMPITIFYGGNGSGKSTALNIIAEKLKLQRTSVFNKTSFFENYLKFCNYETENEIEIPIESKIITSDDVFNYMFNVRAMNQEIDIERKRLIKEYRTIKTGGIGRFNNGDIKGLINYSRDYALAEIDVYIPYIEKISELIEDINRYFTNYKDKNEEIYEDPICVGVSGLLESQMTIRIFVKCKPMTQFKIEREIRKVIWDILNKSNIKYPYNNIIVKEHKDG